MKHMTTRVLAPAFLAATLFAAPAMADKADDTMRVAMAEEILNLDYNYTTKREYIILAQMTDTTLFDLDPRTQEYKPAVATGYAFVDDKTLDITLRDDVKFHDGSVLSAEDVAYTYNWIIREDSESNASGTIGRWLDNAEVTGPNTVRFHLKSVYPLVLRDMAQRIMLRKAGTYDEGGTVDRDAMAQELIGTGPYKVKSFEPGQELVLERFDDYFGEAPAIQTIVVRNLPDIGTQQAELMSGGIDWMFKVPLDLAESLGATPMASHLSGPDLRVAFVVLDAAGYTDADGPLTKVKVRQAINHALNKADMAKFLIGGSAEPIHTACHPAQFGCDQSVQDYPYDPEAAKALLAEAGYPDGFELELWAYRDKAVAEAVSADLSAVGIKVNLRYVKLESLNQARASQDIPAYIGTWGSGGTADTAAIARIHFSMDTDRNLSGDQALADEVLAAEQTNDQDERAEIYSSALSTIADQAYWAPLFTYSANYLVSPELEFPLDPDGLPRLQNASWK
ncbi:ABC transporter substrate-binding protein [Pseudooceanicola sediminis]|uniref:ABC transporter substrate-binding protein n=1 Tax=Pseudooceanicola sediminis TaxID=2211117 RepID=A0A399J2Q4_9RHOB|nr:ABC transporter substrate-binding protein [Pseudooceanicola sediminis]KAA2316051.1 ABC transporter substrate-binding protein [Puniceibacterium sp. HSS470]RII38162.1 ABC transporter substrate-binding protein [Pseudooceanicola sediminis]